MEGKTCPKCKRLLPLSGFACNASKRDGLQSWCRTCKKARDAGYYQRNKDKYLRYNRKQYARLNALLAELKARPCTDCGGIFPPYVMDFDHLDSAEKLFDVGRARRSGLSAIKREIAKCELVCANCHRIRTYKRAQAAKQALLV